MNLSHDRQDMYESLVSHDYVQSEPKTKTSLSPDQLYEALIERIRQYHPSGDISLIKKAYELAFKAHEGQVRKSGEPYIIHPLHVAYILADLELDKETILAGILHDAIEDTLMTEADIVREFGKEVAVLVDGVTKLGQLPFAKDKTDVQAENLRKMFLAMAKDIRVILIKLADRLHNMRTLNFMSEQKQLEKARETMDIYSPLAQRLGISKIKVELDDLSLRYLEPKVYEDLLEKLDSKSNQREAYVANIVTKVQGHMQEAGIKATVYGRVKHLFSIYKKMRNQDKTLEEIYDLFAVRILVKDVKDCYAALGMIHEIYRPIPGRFKDYIAVPKPNKYQSLHTTLIGEKGTLFEIQIRTYEMHRTAEYGIAAHWKYKEASDGKQVSSNQEEEKMAWLREILEWQQEMSDNKEFMTLLKSDLNLFEDSVFCFTPAGDVKNLSAGSTPIDFAYLIHSGVGNKMVGAKANGRLVTIDYKIQNGDIIEIMTSQNSRGPSRDWLKIAHNMSTKNKINQWFKKENKEENVIKGKEALSAYAKAKGLDLAELLQPEYMEKVIRKYSYKDWTSLLASVGYGGLKEGQIVNRLHDYYKRDHTTPITDEQILEAIHYEVGNTKISKAGKGVVVQGINDMSVRFSKCCSPVPGDEIIGYVTRGRGISIHRTDCVNILSMPADESERLIDAEWGADSFEAKGLYLAEVSIYANNRKGLLVDVSRVLNESNIDIQSVNTRTNRHGLATMNLSFEVHGKSQLNDVIGKLHQISDIIDIKRTSG